ncbi:MAG: CSLREA domain-containing protein [Anaerolineae bacterium]|nr:CSLREA domain-containing protein [Anaerolineae bacterium]
MFRKVTVFTLLTIVFLITRGIALADTETRTLATTPETVTGANLSLLINSTEDRVDINLGDGGCDTGFIVGGQPECTLRASIQEANASPGLATINIPSGTYTLTIIGLDEDAAATGDLDITDDVTLFGAGADTTIIDGNQLDRVFHIIGANVEISNVTVRNGNDDGTANVHGGGVRNDNGLLYIANSKITENLRSGFGGDGGGIYNSGQLTLENSEVTHNNLPTTVRGGGIYNEGEASVINSTISDNSPAVGGGIYNTNILSVSNSTIDNNFARFTGGGITNDGGTLAVTTSSLSNNSEGAGIHNLNFGIVTISNTTISGNTGFDAGGGGVRNSEGTLTLVNSTVSGNSSQNNIGGIANGGNLFVINSTISNNTSEEASLAGGLSGTADVKGSIIANNSNADCDGMITDGGYNLDSDGTCNVSLTADSLLALLTNNGGATQTQALQYGSPAIDQIPANQCAVATDQRGVTRPQGAGCDIGAFEFSPLIVTKVEDTADGSCDVTDCSLREAIIAANSQPGHDLVTIPAGTYLLTIDGPDEDAAATGDLDITDDITISGAGADTTLIDGNQLDRVFHIVEAVDVKMAQVTIQNGSALFEGGGIKNDQGYLHITESIVANNYTNDFASNPGAGIANSGVLTIEHSLLKDNSVIYSWGGALYNSNIATLIASTIKDNSAGSGGAIYNSGILLLDKSTLSGNWSRFDGGGITNQPEGEAKLINSTISNNTGRHGAGIFNAEGGQLRLENSTVSSNLEFVGPGGGIQGAAELVNTIVANNATSDCLGGITSLGHNLDSDSTCGLSEPSDLSGVNPLLKPLADNGGPTATQALQANSPALDKGDNTSCPSEDQRDQPRPKDGDGDNVSVCDMGAFEAQQSAQLVNSLLQLQGTSTSYNPTPVENAPVGVFTISAQFTNISSNSLTNIFFKVVTLTRNNVVLNADGGPAGVGATVSVPNDIPAGGSFTINFEIGLQTPKSFNFLVDAYGIPSDTASLSNPETSDNSEGFTFTITEDQIEGRDNPNIYFPLIIK